ncbi:MAG: DUF4783 domain-containing protein [Ignavibacterium sp.]|nr:MAG: DUF4783 domain-containing protein [Ignavibacterium sp.]
MKKLLILIIILIVNQVLIAQDNQLRHNLNSNSLSSKAHGLLDDFEKGISDTKTSDISPYLASQVYLSFLNGVSGYYSSNQAYYVIEKFLKEYKVISFRFNKFKLNTTAPFAIGTYFYEHKGNRSDAKVYVTLKFTSKSWQITQISIK